MRQTLYLFFVFFLLIAACTESTDLPEVAEIDLHVPVLSVPGVILLPDSTGFTEMVEGEHDALLLYCWLPIGQYPESENDLEFLSTINERGVTPVPIQFSAEVRNASQTQMNQLGISISVALGDDSLRNFIIVDNLPAAALVRKDGSVVRAYGFGCAERTLRGIQ